MLQLTGYISTYIVARGFADAARLSNKATGPCTQLMVNRDDEGSAHYVRRAQADEEKDKAPNQADDQKLPSSQQLILSSRKYTSVQPDSP